MLLSDLTQGFLLDCRLRNLSPHTIVAYDAALRLLCDFLSDPDVHSVTPDDLKRYSLYVKERGRYDAGHHPWMPATEQPLSAWSVHHLLRPIKTLFHWAHTEELLPTNPAERLKMPKLPRGRVDRFTDAQIDQLLAAARSVGFRDYCIVLLLLDSGLRRSELLALTLDDVNVGTGLVTVKHGKGDKFREVRVGDACRKALWLYVSKHRAHTADTERTLFTTREGTPLTSNALGSLFVRMSKRLGFPVYAHKFRHTFATNLAKQVPNAFIVAQALGHEDLNTAMIYVHLAASDAVNVSPMDHHLKRR